MKKKRMMVSEAHELYGLVDYVTDDPDAAVVIERRNRKGRAILVDEGHLNYLETTLRELRKRQGSSFRLWGSLASDHSDDEVEAALLETRREQSLLAEAKLAAIVAEG